VFDEMDNTLKRESGSLRDAWQQYPAEHLDTYLVRDVEDPRINVQSILIRSLLIDSLFPDKFTGLIDEELRFSVCLNWILGRMKEGYKRPTILDALEWEKPNDTPFEIPKVVAETYSFLQQEKAGLTDYITAALVDRCDDTGALLPESATRTFGPLWGRVLSEHDAERISVLEPACGSANDYRFLQEFGLARFLDYTGLDLCDTNIENARQRFPDVEFSVGNVIEMPFEENRFDYTYIQDLFEHLSPSALDRSLSEIVRVTRREAWLGFFNLSADPCHEFKKVSLYHWNRLSAAEIVSRLKPHCSNIEIIWTLQLLRHKFGSADYYNPGACTLVLTLE